MPLRNGEVSFWHASLPQAPPARPPLPHDVDADVCVVGAGLTGLWTAYHLASAAPELRIVVLDRAFAGFGASGRNGGWLSGTIPGSLDRYASMAGGGSAGRQVVREWQRMANAEVDHVIEICAGEAIVADIVKAGSLRVATTPAQLTRMRASLASARSWGLTDEDLVELDPEEVTSRVRVARARGGLFSPHCARLNPAQLVAGLAVAVERRGVTIYEATPVERLQAHRALTPFGEVRARWLVRATEGYSAGLPSLRRAWLPMNSSMVVTEPLDEGAWDEIGWAGCETLSDLSNAYVYAQRTADGRIAIGGRGIPYRYGSATDRQGVTQARTIAMIEDALHRLLPATRCAALAHAWCGVLAVARDWCASVGAEPDSGLAYAGGYVGNGVTMASLAGRTLADLILGADSALVRMPWVGHVSRRWEPEPLRWLGVQGIYALYRAADALEDREKSGRTSVLARAADAISGRH